MRLCNVRSGKGQSAATKEAKRTYRTQKGVRDRHDGRKVSVVVSGTLIRIDYVTVSLLTTSKRSRRLKYVYEGHASTCSRLICRLFSVGFTVALYIY